MHSIGSTTQVRIEQGACRYEEDGELEEDSEGDPAAHKGDQP